MPQQSPHPQLQSMSRAATHRPTRAARPSLRRETAGRLRPAPRRAEGARRRDGTPSARAPAMYTRVMSAPAPPPGCAQMHPAAYAYQSLNNMGAMPQLQSLAPVDPAAAMAATMASAAAMYQAAAAHGQMTMWAPVIGAAGGQQTGGQAQGVASQEQVTVTEWASPARAADRGGRRDSPSLLRGVVFSMHGPTKCLVLL